MSETLFTWNHPDKAFDMTLYDDGSMEVDYHYSTTITSFPKDVVESLYQAMKLHHEPEVLQTEFHKEYAVIVERTEVDELVHVGVVDEDVVYFSEYLIDDCRFRSLADAQLVAAKAEKLVADPAWRSKLKVDSVKVVQVKTTLREIDDEDLAKSVLDKLSGPEIAAIKKYFGI